MSKKSFSRSGGGNGIMGSGIFGMFGTTIRCDSKDDSMYCNLMKFFNVFFMILLFLVVIYFIYNFFSMYMRSGKSRR